MTIIPGLLFLASFAMFVLVISHSIVLPRLTELGLSMAGLSALITAFKLVEGSTPPNGIYILAIVGAILVFTGFKIRAHSRRKSTSRIFK